MFKRVPTNPFYPKVNEKIKAIQGIIGVTPDGIWGEKSQAALSSIIAASQSPASASESPALSGTAEIYKGKASSFADPADIKAFKRCKAEGKTDQECFKVGDNGIGAFGDSTVEGTGPCCAIPGSKMIARWGSKDAARFKEISVSANGKSAVVKVKDRLPENSPNGAIIDLNPDAGALLGLTPPFLVPCTWSWV